MEATPENSRYLLENTSSLMLLTTLIAGGFIGVILIRYVVSRLTSRSSSEQDSSKKTDQASWEPVGAPLNYVPIVQESSPIYTDSLRNGQRVPLNKKRNKQVSPIPPHSWLSATLKGHSDLICDMSFSSNGKYVASSAEDRTLQLEEHVQWQSSHYRCSLGNEVNVTSILLSPYPNLMTPSSMGNNRYQRMCQERILEIQEQITLANGYKPDNRRRKQIRGHTLYNVNEDTDTDVDWKMIGKQLAADINDLHYCDNYRSERQNILLNDSALFRAIGIYALTTNDLTSRGYPVESPDLPNCALINNIIYPTNHNYKLCIRNIITATEKEKNYKEDQDNGNCISIDNTIEHEQTNSSNECLNVEKNSNSEKKYNDNAKKYGSSQQRERKCVRCYKVFHVDNSGKYLQMERCSYHWGKLFDGRTNGELNHKYWTCCRNSESSLGCETGVHVWNGLLPGLNGPLTGYVRTLPSTERSYDDNDDYGIYAIDCEMCYTQHGLELTKVSLVDLFGNVIYDTFVKPSAEIIDYNTRFSGITEKHMSKVTKTLREVQKDLMTFIHAETILLGHNLAGDFRMLRLLHKNVVDTTVMFPHNYGFPYCMALKTLARKVLKRNIHESTHDSIEDARVVVDLVLRKVHYEVTNGNSGRIHRHQQWQNPHEEEQF